VQRPPTRYARSGELAIAYQVHGSGDRDMLVSGGSASNIETMWDIPEAAQLFERLGRFARVIRYDRRDSGQSDPIKDDLTLEAHADDALAVMDAVGTRRPVLMGALDGARSLALLAATRPDRVGGLIALAPTVRGGAASSPDLADKAAKALTELEDFPGSLTALYAPAWAADPARRDAITRYIQTATRPRQAARLLRMSLTSDIRDVLPLVQAPTLALHPRDLELVAAAAVREFTDLVPGASFREVPGDAGFVFALDVELIADICEEFVTGAAPAGVTDRILATVLFTDLVDSTKRAAQSGDRAWAALLDRHLDHTRTAVADHGGETVKTTGDGVLALFTGPAQGVRCAEQVIADANELGLDVRTGLHTGEVERSRDDIAGLAVHLAARIMSLASAGEILVSRTVRDLVIGSELTFSDRGEHELKGIPDRWAIYAAA
jgi:class 3 adenylate cyclase/pimeloyl-ACP methyl ester carboxylesterase